MFDKKYIVRFEMFGRILSKLVRNQKYVIGSKIPKTKNEK